MKFKITSVLLAQYLAQTCVRAESLKQLNTEYIVPYKLVNGIAMADFSFPDTFIEASDLVLIDLQQGIPSAWNCTGTPICD
jgi:hypothetical protein